jgi:tRNA modification GTPase
MDLVSARTAEARETALAAMHGAMASAVGDIRNALSEIRAEIEACIDFCQDIEEPDFPALSAALKERGLLPLLELIDRSICGQVFREGLRVAIVGRPNVGKSSLLNAMLGRERAIVSPHPGTTRDVIEESGRVGDYLCVLADTAGFHESPDPVERAGMERATTTYEAADVVVLVVDASRPLAGEDAALYRRLAGKRVVAAANKSDLARDETVAGPFPGWEGTAWIPVSAKTGKGIPELGKAIIESFLEHEEAPSSGVSPNMRQRGALLRAAAATESAIKQLSGGGFPELAAADISEALSALGEVTGETASPDVLDSIFSRFCVGK